MKNQNRTLLRFLALLLFSYVFFYIFPFPADDFFDSVHLKDVGEVYTKLNDKLTLWIGKSLLGLNELEKIEVTGSGDTTFDFVRLLTTLLLAFLTAVILFLVGLKQETFEHIRAFVVVYARYFLGFMLIFYGIVKLFEGQFITPSAAQLDKAYGDGSPMNLLWTFMGYSRSYTFFAGLAETVGGVLLLFRRSTYLGCLVAIGVMANVVMLNFSYDVPVKLFSMHLLLLAVFILAPALPTITAFFFGKRSVTLAAPPELFLPKKWMQVTRLVLKPLLVIGLPLLSILEYKAYEIPKPHPMSATYEPLLFVVNQDTLVQIQPDSLHWKKLMIDRFYSKVITHDGQQKYYRYDVDTSARTMKLIAYRDSSEVHAFSYEWIDSTQILLQGVYRSDTLTAQLKMKRPADYLLMSRGFHWVSEYPFNR